MRSAIGAAGALLFVLAAPSPQSEAQPAKVLSWPVACTVGVNCAIQHYLDQDPSPAAKDFACGNRTYDGHDGVDIRLLDMAAQRRGVAVLAAADGRVLRVRDGVPDVSVRATGLEAVKDRECGNGLVVAHGDFEAQYCHLAQGSVSVKPGDMVKAGQPIGRVGLSGETEFPHLHFTLRQGGKAVDPFAYGAPAGACRGGRSLWSQTPAYEARVVLNTGFAAQALTMGAVEAGVAPAGADPAALVAYVRAIGLKAGDVQTLTISGPNGATLVKNAAEPLPRDQAQRLIFAGIRRPAQGWAKGRYVARYTVAGGGQTAIERTFELRM
jgi:hypothetical protein